MKAAFPDRDGTTNKDHQDEIWRIIQDAEKGPGSNRY